MTVVTNLSHRGPSRDQRANPTVTVIQHLGKKSIQTKAHYQAFFWVLIDLIVDLLGLIIKPFDNQTQSWNPVSNDLIIKSFDTIIW